ncbi:hypothetical protein O181_120908 [Austropuccinia psidii MF-1]|uniref:Uncharacterized protein n=1 Tax=Austropuccinia psidii MF-1 TaxID=1389203 RepID=A0A9Q3Q0S7_9BASI|nr:hypothetical protein [Austropuccinia psidii MF-1]
MYGPTTNWNWPSNTSPPCHIPLPGTSHYIKISVPIQSRYANHSHRENPEAPSGVGSSETGNSFPKGPSFLLHKYVLMLEDDTPVQRHGFFTMKQKWHFEDWGL